MSWQCEGKPGPFTLGGFTYEKCPGYSDCSPEDRPLTPLERVAFWSLELTFCTASERAELQGELAAAQADAIVAGHSSAEIDAAADFSFLPRETDE